MVFLLAYLRPQDHFKLWKMKTEPSILASCGHTLFHEAVLEMLKSYEHMVGTQKMCGELNDTCLSYYS